MSKLKESKLFIPLKSNDTRQDSKIPLENGWQTKQPYTWQEVQLHNNIGMRLDNLVAVDFDDIDDKEEKSIILEAQKHKCIIHKTGDKPNEANPNPKKGLQLIFKLPEKVNSKKQTNALSEIHIGSNMPLLFGLSADIKAGHKSQVVIRLMNYDGDRSLNSQDLNVRDYTLNEIDELPQIFYPLARQQSLDKKLDWSEGGRNQMWMNFTRYLTGAFDKITELECINICKKVEEIHSINNDDYKNIIPDWYRKARKVGKFEGDDKLFWRTQTGVLIEDRLVDSCIEQMRVRRYNGKLYVKRDHERLYVTESDSSTIKTRLYDLDYQLTATNVDNVVRKLIYYAPQGQLEEDWMYLIYTPTQVINVKTQQSRNIKIDEFYIHSYNVEYNKNAYDEGVEKFLNDISSNSNIDKDTLIPRQEVKDDILQALAVGMIPESFRKLFMFYGKGSNGKGTLFKMYNSLFSSNSVRHVALEKIIDDQFMAHMMKDILVNISDELSIQFFKEFGTIKSLISNDEIHGRGMHEVGESFKPHVTLYLQGNMIPRTKEKTNAINNRLVFIPMDFVAQTQGSVINFAKQYLTVSAQEYLFKLLIEKLMQVVKDDKLSYSTYSIDLHKMFTQSNDPVEKWLEEMGVNYFIDQNRHVGMFFEDYQLHPDKTLITQRVLTSKIKEYFNLKSKINGYKDPLSGQYNKTTLVPRG